MAHEYIRKQPLHYLTKNFMAVAGLVLIWRGVWHLMDAIDIYLLNGNQFITPVLGIIVGFALLYLPDHDLKEIEQL